MAIILGYRIYIKMYNYLSPRIADIEKPHFFATAGLFGLLATNCNVVGNSMAELGDRLSDRPLRTELVGE